MRRPRPRCPGEPVPSAGDEPALEAESRGRSRVSRSGATAGCGSAVRIRRWAVAPRNTVGESWHLTRRVYAINVIHETLTKRPSMRSPSPSGNRSDEGVQQDHRRSQSRSRKEHALAPTRTSSLVSRSTTRTPVTRSLASSYTTRSTIESGRSSDCRSFLAAGSVAERRKNTRPNEQPRSALVAVRGSDRAPSFNCSLVASVRMRRPTDDQLAMP